MYTLTDAAAPDQTLDGALRRAGRFGVEVGLPGLGHALRRKLILGELLGSRLDLTAVAGDLKNYTELVWEQLEKLWARLGAQKDAENALEEAVAAANGRRFADVRRACRDALGRGELRDEEVVEVLRKVAREVGARPAEGALERLEPGRFGKVLFSGADR